MPGVFRTLTQSQTIILLVIVHLETDAKLTGERQGIH